jgi:hypothetical protein
MFPVFKIYEIINFNYIFDIGLIKFTFKNKFLLIMILKIYLTI